MSTINNKNGYNLSYEEYHTWRMEMGTIVYVHDIFTFIELVASRQHGGWIGGGVLISGGPGNHRFPSGFTIELES
jgi:hypothetical protein